MSKNLDRLLTMICGVTGMGKSYFMKKTLLPILAKYKPVIVFDRMGEYAGPRAKDVPKNKWKFYNGIESFFDSIKAAGNVLEKEVHVISCEKNADYIKGIGLFKALEKPVTLVVEEAHDLFTAAEFKEVGAALTGIARFGRKFGIGFILVTQRTIDVPKDVRSQFLGKVISFKQTLESDVKALKEIGCENPERVLALDKRKYQVFGELPKHISKGLK